MWTLLAGAVALDVAADVTYSDVYPLFGQHDVFPSAADALYAAAYLLVLPAVCLAFAPAGRRGGVRLVLDSAIFAVVGGFAGAELLVGPLHQQLGNVLATAVAVTYPTLDVVALGLIGALTVGSGRRPPPALLLIGVAYAVSGLSDTIYTYLSVTGTYDASGFVDMGWEGWAVVLCLAAVVALRDPRTAAAGAAPRSATGRDVGLPAILAGTATMVGIVLADLADGDGTVTTPVAIGTMLILLAVIARLLVTSGDRTRAATQLVASITERERLARTDALTGLGNRRVFDEAIDVECRRAFRERSSLALLVVDLDRFRTVNETFGHRIGDAVLGQVAGRLLSATRPGDTVVREGGEEFAILMPGVDAAEVAVVGDRVRRAVSDGAYTLPDGRTITLTTSLGAATLPAHAATPRGLMTEADRALAEAKALGRNQVHVGTAVDPRELDARGAGAEVLDYLQRLVDEVEEDHNGDEHSVAIARWVTAVCDDLGVPPSVRRRCAMAARFHDVGKVAVPEEILRQPRALTPGEWEIVHQHPLVGARLLALAPGLSEVAEIVASHHERWDGSGYPCGRRADEIPIEARVIAVCDAWAAMRGDRPYGATLDRAVAADELRRHAGTQFDATVVDSFLRLESRGELAFDEHRPTLTSASA